jgi:hypothetical protein
VSSKVDKIARVEKKRAKKEKEKEKAKGQQPKKVDCGTMLVNEGSRAG